jgi:hypothetical protein
LSSLKVALDADGVVGEGDIAPDRVEQVLNNTTSWFQAAA